MADPLPPGHERAASGGGGVSASRSLVGGALAWMAAPFGLGGAASSKQSNAAVEAPPANAPRSAPSSAPAKSQFARAPTRTPGTVRQAGATAAVTSAAAASSAAHNHTTAANAAAALDSAAPSAISSRRNSTGNAAEQPSKTVCVRTESAPLSDDASDSLSSTATAAMSRHIQAADSAAVFPVPASAAPSSETMPLPAAAAAVAPPAAVTLLGASKHDSARGSSRHRSTPPRDALSSDSDLEGSQRHAGSLDSLHAHPHALSAHFRRPLPPHRIQPSPPASPTPDDQASAAAAVSHPVAAVASRPHSQSSADALEDEDGSQQRLFKLMPFSPADALPTGSPDTTTASLPAAQWVQSNTLAAAQATAPSAATQPQLPPADQFQSLHATTAASSAEPARPPLHQSQSSQQQLEMHQQLLQANAHARAVTAAAETPFAPAPAPAAPVSDPSLAMAHASSAPNLPALAALPSAAAAMPSMPSVPDLSSYSSAHFEEAQAAEAAAAAASAAETASSSSASPAESILPGFFGFGSSSRANSGLAAAAASAAPSPDHVRSQSSSDNLAAGLAASSSTASAAAASAPPRNIKLLNFQRVLSADVLDLAALKRLSWSGIPASLRGQSWKLMLGYLPVHLARRPAILAKRREEYASYLVDHYYCGMDSEAYYAACEAAAAALGSPCGAGQAPLPSPVSRSESDHEILKQIQQDVPRTSPGLVWFKLPGVQRALERVLFIFAVRHPASGYVQGINDLVTPFMTVFLMESYGLDILSASTAAEAESLLASSPLASTADAWATIEADCYWCLSALIDSIQDHYTFAQPGIQKMIYRLQELILRIDGNTSATVASGVSSSSASGGAGGGGAAGSTLVSTGSTPSALTAPHIGLHAHLARENVQFLHFAFRWMTCLLMRELRLPLILRLWDSYLSEPSLAAGFREMHIYVCAALVMRFKDAIKSREFQQIIQFMQKLPTGLCHHTPAVKQRGEKGRRGEASVSLCCLCLLFVCCVQTTGRHWTWRVCSRKPTSIALGSMLRRSIWLELLRLILRTSAHIDDTA